MKYFPCGMVVSNNGRPVRNTSWIRTRKSAITNHMFIPITGFFCSVLPVILVWRSACRCSATSGKNHIELVYRDEGENEAFYGRSTTYRVSLFQARSSYGNVVLNFQHVANDEFAAYAEALHQAGQALATMMFDKAGYNDLEACPIIFLYHHALELYLKAVALERRSSNQAAS